MTLRVILVEDDDQLRRSLRRLLEKRGIAVVEEAVDGTEGLAAAQRTSFDILLSDLRMPTMDGIELTRRVRAIDPSATVVIFSAYADQSLQAEALQAGVAAWIAKGSPPSELVDKLLEIAATHAG